jgi:hypothetical protein
MTTGMHWKIVDVRNIRNTLHARSRIAVTCAIVLVEAIKVQRVFSYSMLGYRLVSSVDGIIDSLRGAILCWK